MFHRNIQQDQMSLLHVEQTYTPPPTQLCWRHISVNKAVKFRMKNVTLRILSRLARNGTETG